MDIVYEQEICASKSEAEVAMTSSEDTSFSYFNETYFKKHVIRHQEQGSYTYCYPA